MYQSIKITTSVSCIWKSKMTTNSSVSESTDLEEKVISSIKVTKNATYLQRLYNLPEKGVRE